MKKLSETLTELGIAFSFPIEIKDANGKVTYYERSKGYCERYERAADGCPTYFEDSNGYWYRYERDANGKETYFEDSSDFWCRYERGANGEVTYYENSEGVKRSTPKSTNQ